MKTSTCWLTAAFFALLSGGNAAAGPVLYSVADDANGIPRVVEQISPGAQTVSSAVTLGDGSISFAGGLAYDSPSDTFFTPSWDGFNPSNLSSFQIAGGGSTTPLFAAGYGFFDGLVEIDSTDFYAIASAFDGSSTLYELSSAGSGSVTSVMSLGFGFNGGLAADGTGLLYAIGNDDEENSTLYSIDPSAETLGLGLALGQGFDGGLAWDPGSQSLYAIGNDFEADSTLYQIDLGPTPTTTALFALGQGYLNASLVDVSSPTPEPSSGILGALGAAGILLGLRRKTRGW
jgi:hypothetical protein